MSLFWIYFICLPLFLPVGRSVPYPSYRCSKNDCSYQLPDFGNEICKIYNTSGEEFTGKNLTSEEESKFHVSILPYTAELVSGVAIATRSAINITFSINNADVEKLVVKLYKKRVRITVCRIFDFHNASNSTKFPIHLFYDCLFGSHDHDMQSMRVDFIALPIKEQLSYDVFVPATVNSGSCTWQPLIMVFRGSLLNGVVQVKFSQAQKFYNVSSYEVKLTQLSGGEKIVDIKPNINKTMLSVQFSSLDEDNYMVSVRPVIWGVRDICWTETDIFHIEKLKSDQMYIVYVCIFILLIFSAFVFLKLFRHNIAKLRFGSKRRILLFYSHDCKEHKDFVVAFIRYMIKHCHVEVFTIYDELPVDWYPDEKPVNDIPNVIECNPLEWITKKYNECDIFMFLISAGLVHILDEKNPLPIQKFHEWRDQLTFATNLISIELRNNAEDIKKKKICKVRFPYSSEEKIPDTLRTGFGRCYNLPEEMNNLINFMHDCKECFLCSKLWVTNFESSFEGTDLCTKMRDVQAAVDNKSHKHILKAPSDTAMNDLDCNEESVNPDEYFASSDSSDENSDIIDILSCSTPKHISKERFSNLSSSSSDICPMRKSEDLVELTIHEPIEDFDSNESDSFHYQLKVNTENEAKYMIESFLNEN